MVFKDNEKGKAIKPGHSDNRIKKMLRTVVSSWAGFADSKYYLSNHLDRAETKKVTGISQRWFNAQTKVIANAFFGAGFVGGGIAYVLTGNSEPLKILAGVSTMVVFSTIGTLAYNYDNVNRDNKIIESRHLMSRSSNLFIDEWLHEREKKACK